MIRVFMNSGAKETAKHHVYAALEIIKRKQYKAWLKAKDEEEKVSVLAFYMISASKGVLNIYWIDFRVR